MTASGTIVATLRQRAGLTQHTLAMRAGCTRSTIARIENGTMDPTVTMLARITAATGHRLTLDTTDPLPRHSLATIASNTAPNGEIPWTALRALLDWTRLHPTRTSDVIADPPPRTGNDHLDNLLAGIAEKLATDSNIRTPPWTSDVPPPPTDLLPPGTPRMRARERAAAPEQLARRRIFIATDNLWRPSHD